ncbi:MAG: DUF2442 domain-containing protein [Culturomica sp.]|jgi:hypothetical protein|nr:DUF2442 domain-containing protein [Culturomica sp.]
MKIQKLWFEDEKVFILTDDGRKLWQSLLWYPRLKNATAEQRMDFEYDEIGIRWEEIDEDMSVESFLYDDPEPQGISRLFLTHPELNASAVARRMGIQRSLLAAYIRGTKKPSVEREEEIKEAVRQIGKELVKV